MFKRNSNSILSSFFDESDKKKEIINDIDRCIEILLKAKVVKFDPELSEIIGNAVYQLDEDDYNDLFVLINGLKLYFGQSPLPKGRGSSRKG